MTRTWVYAGEGRGSTTRTSYYCEVSPMTYSMSRRYFRLDDICPAVPSGGGLYGALSGAGYLAAAFVGAVSAIWLSSWLG